MKIAVHVNEDELFDKKWITFLERKDIEVIRINIFSKDALDKIKVCDGLMWHFRHIPSDKQLANKILPVIEEVLNIPVWPNFNSRWHFDEKIAQHYLLSALQVPSVKSWVFWNYDEAAQFIEDEAQFPLVFKLSVGAGAANVVKVSSKDEAELLITKMFNEGIFPYSINEYSQKSKLVSRIRNSCKYVIGKKNIPLPQYYEIQKGYVYFQSFLEGNDYDIRITVIGDRIFGFIRYNRKDDFRASGSGNIDVNPDNIPIETIKIAYNVSKSNGFQSMAYDFLKDKNGMYVINEMSYGYVDVAIYDCPGYWDPYMNWHKGHIWPEEAHVEDFVRYINTKEERERSYYA